MNGKMDNDYMIIDESSWPRASHCKAFRGWAQPSIYMAFEVDVTEFQKKTRSMGLSFTLAVTYAVCLCANSVENFRYRFQDGKVVLYNSTDCLFTYLNRETELFKMIKVPMTEDIESFVALAGKTAEQQKEYFTGPPGNGVIRCTAIPWVSFTQMSSAYSGKPDYSTPVIAWGKYHDVNGRSMMPVSVQANHSFVDGLHIGKFAEALQNYLNS